MKKEDMNVVIVGHVDHGKSTLIGRLLADTNSLPKGKLDSVKLNCQRNSKPFEYAFLLDALKNEQSQGITIDIARCFFKTNKRNYIILDAPGHIEFLKNMISGAARADAAVLVIDANEGIKENSKRHGYMLSMLGIKQVVVAINKMDLINYDEKKFNEIKDEYTKFLEKLNIYPMEIIPISAFNGDNVAVSSENMSWYNKGTILQLLDRFECTKPKDNLPFRMPVQDVYKFTENGDRRRIVAGTIDTGTIHINDKVKFFSSKKESTIKTIEVFPEKNKATANSKEAIGFTLDEQIYIKRAELMTIVGEQEPIVSDKIDCNVFWLGKHNLNKNVKYYIKLGTEKVGAKLIEIKSVMDSSSLELKKQDFVCCNEVAECIFQFDKEIAFDKVEVISETGRFVIIDGYEISGGGTIIDAVKEQKDRKKLNKATNLVWQKSEVTYEDRCNNLNQEGRVIWFTGLSGAGKTTIANEFEKYLNINGYATYMLDGDNIRHGINKDLGFTEEDRIENIRRITEIAKLFHDAGIIVLVSFITPFEEMRENARKLIGENNVLEVYVKASIETCIKRDPKGLYKKQIENFTGLTSPYEIPKKPNIVLDTEKYSIEDTVNILIEEIERIGVLRKCK